MKLAGVMAPAFISSENVIVIGALTITLTASRAGEVETTAGTVVGVGTGVDADTEGASFVVGAGEAGVTAAAGNVAGAADGPAQAPIKTIPIIRIAKSVFIFIADVIPEFLT